jgi:predicted RNA-binding protein YlqC (UPF0109 family)
MLVNAIINALCERPHMVSWTVNILELTAVTKQIEIVLTFKDEADCARFIGRRGHSLANIRKVFHKVSHRFGYSRMMFNVVDPMGKASGSQTVQNLK